MCVDTTEYVLCEYTQYVTHGYCKVCCVCIQHSLLCMDTAKYAVYVCVCTWILHSMLCVNTNSMLCMGYAKFAVICIQHCLLCMDTLHFLNVMCTVPFQ